jgi:hypothetical protein
LKAVLFQYSFSLSAANPALAKHNYVGFPFEPGQLARNPIQWNVPFTLPETNSPGLLTSTKKAPSLMASVNLLLSGVPNICLKKSNIFLEF